MNIPERGAFSVAEFCEWAGGISQAWAWQQLAEGKLASVKCGRRRLIPIEDAKAWLNRQRHEAINA